MPLLIVRSALATGVLFAAFPAPSAPPMKMGLWEQTSVIHMKMSGGKMPPGMPAEQTVKSRACYTPETWATLLSGSNKSCTFSNQSFTGPHISIDISCAQMAMKMHIDGTFSTPETGHGAVHMDVDNPQMKIESDSTYETHFISSDCGSVGPGKTVMVR